MPDNNSSRKDFNPKHRIVGAIVLVSLAVIFVPMLLDKHDAAPVSPAVVQLTQIPPQNEVMVADVTASPPPVAAPAHPSPVTVAPVAAVPTTPVTPASAPAARTIPVAARGGGKGWFVQVGTFAQSRNAEQIAHRLKARGYPVNLEQVALADGRGLRVRVGPYEHKDQARKAQADIQHKVGVHGDVRSE